MRIGNDNQKVIELGFCFTVQIHISIESLGEEEDFLGLFCTFE